MHNCLPLFIILLKTILDYNLILCMGYGSQTLGAIWREIHLILPYKESQDIFKMDVKVNGLLLNKRTCHPFRGSRLQGRWIAKVILSRPRNPEKLNRFHYPLWIYWSQCRCKNKSKLQWTLDVKASHKQNGYISVSFV